MKYLLVLLLSGCVGLGEMKLRDGETGCETLSSVYGSVSRVVNRADNTPKGSSSTGKTRVTCGAAVMEMDSSVTTPTNK